MTVTAGVAAIKGTYSGTCGSATCTRTSRWCSRPRARGRPGTIAPTCGGFTDTGDGPRLTYDADAIVGGMIGGVGQRMLGSVVASGWRASSSATSSGC